jgi:diguanylate cyclase (GGDEF)-like protein
MRWNGKIRAWLRHLSLTRQVAVLSLIPVVALGVILAHVLQTQIAARTLADASQSARLLARVGIQPALTPKQMRDGLTPGGVHALDEQLRTPSVAEDLARIKIWNAQNKVIYSEDHRLIGQTLPPSDDLLDALAGRARPAVLVTPSAHGETASEVGLGQLVEIYVPLSFGRSTRPAGAFEMYLSYKPIAAAVAANKRTIVLLIAVGLALLWAILYRIVARASRRLRQQAEENDRLARYDQLTGLPNRTLFIERVEESVGRTALPTHSVAMHRDSVADSVAILLIDLDRFTEINNTLGFANGDLVLREVARRIDGELGDGTLLARLGGDSYAVLLSHAAGVGDALSTARLLQASLESAIALDDTEVGIEASIGIAVTEAPADTPSLLLQRADAALAHARSRRTGVEVYSSECEHFDAAGLALLGQVRSALSHREFVLHYQPQADLRTGEITGVEALVRWRHPVHGMLPPARFIPLIEQTALIGPLTLHLIEQAVAQMVAWRALGISLQMSVNLSARNLLDAELPRHVAEILNRHQIAPDRLVLEITESAAMVDPRRAVAVLSALRANGIGVSVDDFGTGNASIEYLATLPATELKIDRSFITGMLEDPRAEAIVRSTIDLARNLDLTVVGEGIETKDVMDRLADLGCQTGQGYFIARPQSAEDLAKTLAAAFGLGPTRAAPNGSTRAVTHV